MLIAAVLSLWFAVSTACADRVELSLHFVQDYYCPGEPTDAWSVWAQIIDTPDGADGSFGLSAVRILLDGVNPDVTIAPGLGAIDPIDPDGSPRPAVIVTEGGTLDILYGQDLSESNGRTVVPGVGTQGMTLIASGTRKLPLSEFASWGDDVAGLTSTALFLSGDSSPYGSAIDADEVVFTQLWSWIALDLVTTTPADSSGKATSISCS